MSGEVKALAGVLSVMARVTPARTTIPVLGSCRVAVDGAGVEFVATDLDVVARVRVEALTAEGGDAVLLPVKYLADLCRHLEGEFKLEASGSEAELRCGRGKYSLNLHDGSAYPEVKAPEAGLEVEVEFCDLQRVAGRVAVACATDFSRPSLAGVLWEAGEDGVVLVATDGTRLACWQLEQPFPEQRKVVVPGRSLGVAAKMASPPEGEKVKVLFEDRFVWFRASGWTVGCRLLSAPYPEWRQVIPKQFQCSFEVPLAGFRAALERAGVLAEDGPIRPVRLAVRPGVVEVDSSATVGQAHEEVEAGVEGSPLEITFNAAILLEGLAALQSEKVRMDLVGPENAAVLRDPADDGYLYLALPLRAR